MEKHDLRQRVAYVQGLLNGYKTGDPSGEQVLSGIVECLDSVVGSLSSLEESQEELEAYVHELDDGLTSLEEGGLVEQPCPHCGERLHFSEDFLEEDLDLICPYCGEVVHDTEVDYQDPEHEEGPQDRHS